MCSDNDATDANSLVYVGVFCVSMTSVLFMRYTRAESGEMFGFVVPFISVIVFLSLSE
jgi:hypothetical protein